MDFNWLAIFIAALLGLVLGALIAQWFNKSDEEAKEKLIALEKEFDAYREEVSDHFVETAAMVNQLTSSYKNVYDHLEKGAYKLVGQEELHKRLENVDTKPVLLEYIGAKPSTKDGQDSSQAQSLKTDENTQEEADNLEFDLEKEHDKGQES